MLKWVGSLIIYYLAFYAISVLTNFCPCNNPVNDWVANSRAFFADNSWVEKSKSWLITKKPEKSSKSKTNEMDHNKFINNIVDSTLADPEKYSKDNVKSQPPAAIIFSHTASIE